ncbi:zinc finger protein 22-like [Paramacrobiotus metropolitanus]|uniref:zinc finger protein 22-like n=1 Tax=Paramacrobiotus metropolitanus TaxID=2943436 RepID=UPI002445AD5B|nr:zinc finger protein 22-like [Paramacrobiotus metropolitanus]XP_055328357.1 zinc finger protein 22-like [Paramacrobiotus metropolitanus]
MSGRKSATEKSKAKQKQCPVCSKWYASQKTFNIHNRIHTGFKPHCCGLCPKKFAQGNALKAHIDAHKGNRNWICDICSKAFIQSAHLRTHQRVHSRIRKHQCGVSHPEFSSNDIHDGGFKIPDAKYDRHTSASVARRSRRTEKKYSCATCLSGRKTLLVNEHQQRSRKVARERQLNGTNLLCAAAPEPIVTIKREPGRKMRSNYLLPNGLPVYSADAVKVHLDEVENPSAAVKEEPAEDIAKEAALCEENNSSTSFGEFAKQMFQGVPGSKYSPNVGMGDWLDDDATTKCADETEQQKSDLVEELSPVTLEAGLDVDSEVLVEIMEECMTLLDDSNFLSTVEMVLEYSIPIN